MKTSSLAAPSRHRFGRSRAGRCAAATCALVLAAAAGFAQNTQTVTPTDAFQNKAPSEAVLVTFAYTATDATMAADPTTTGIGLRIHFNSSRLVFNSVTGVFGTGGGASGPLFVMGPSTVENDNGNQDGDAATDKILLLAWAHTESGFPGAVPQDLFTLNFTTAADFAASTNVNVSAVDTATGFGFASSPATIAPVGAPTPTPTPSGPTPTPTPSPTPSGDTAVLDIDGNGIVHGPSDGIAILRWMFGFTGSDLITDVIAPPPSCSRCTAAEVEAYLTLHNSALDIDGNGIVHGPSDGIAILRWMFGFTGSDLITDVVAPPPSCTRCTAAEVENYLQSLSE